MSAEECLLWAYERFGDKLCLTCSWQKQSSVLVHMVTELGIDIPVVELDTGIFFRERYDVWKIQPLVDWDAKRVDAYIHVNEIPYNPLHDAGYPSIGCIPCTRPVSRDQDERAGRWADSDKIECGIHTK